jgi:hypothetical protein
MPTAWAGQSRSAIGGPTTHRATPLSPSSWTSLALEFLGLPCRAVWCGTCGTRRRGVSPAPSGWSLQGPVRPGDDGGGQRWVFAGLHAGLYAAVGAGGIFLNAGLEMSSPLCVPLAHSLPSRIVCVHACCMVVASVPATDARGRSMRCPSIIPRSLLERSWRQLCMRT